jgi:23S rRNA (uracil1939-C5)-methyltransferase
MTEELTLGNPAYGGDSIGRQPDGRAVFVPFGLPGETVRIRISQQKKRYARGELLEILEPSPHRIPPRCPHFVECGGCHYQHMSYEQQLITKQNILQDQLERIGKLSQPPVAGAIPSPANYNYRNQVQFQISAGGKLGFFRAIKKGLIEIAECHLPQGPLNEIWPLLEIDPAIQLDTIRLRLGVSDDMLVTFASAEPFNAEFNLEALPVSVVHSSPGGVQVLAGSPYNMMRVRDRDFKVSAGSFFQVNTAMAEKMVATIEDLIPAKSNLLLDLYAGVGLFSAFLARRVDKLVAVEMSPSACDDFVENLDEFDNVELYQGSVEEILPIMELGPDLVLLDPPRAGVDKRTLEKILSFSADQILYISCDPATLARDSKILSEGGYKPETFIPFDLFCQTYHIETISNWRRI